MSTALGFDSVTISARAVAEHKLSQELAIFAKKDYQCWPYVIDWVGSNITVDGDAHSNAGLTVTGTNNTLTGDLTYESTCQSAVRDGQGANPSMPSSTAISRFDWPLDYVVSDFPCTTTITNPNLTNSENKNLWVGNKVSSKQLKPGVICYKKDGNWMTLDADGISGTVTLVAQYIRVEGANNNLTAYMNGVLLHAYGKDFPTMEVTASGGTMNGILYQRRHDQPSVNIPRGQIIINGSNGFKLNGSIVSWIVRLEGNNWSIVNTLNGTPEPVRLVE